MLFKQLSTWVSELYCGDYKLDPESHSNMEDFFDIGTL